MKSNNTRFVLFFTVGAIIASSISPTLYAQSTAINQALSALEEYTAKLQQSIQKIIRCARGAATCSPMEITQTRLILGVVGAAIATLAITGGVGIGRYAIRRKPGIPPVQEPTPPSEPGVSPETPLRPKVDIDQPAPSPDNIQELISTIKDYAATEKPINREDIIDAINNLVNYGHQNNRWDSSLQQAISNLMKKYNLKAWGRLGNVTTK